MSSNKFLLVADFAGPTLNSKPIENETRKDNQKEPGSKLT